MANTITPLLEAARDCVVDELLAQSRPVTQGCIVIGEAVADGCDCEDGISSGRVWARLVNGFFSSTVASKWPIGVWELSVEVGIWRCVSAHNGECALSTADAAALADDTASLVQAITCCTVVNAYPWNVGSISILGPRGGCVGVALAFEVQVPRLSTL